MRGVADLSQEIACSFKPVCGVDEVGRGPWAGPIVAGAVILTDNHGIDGIADSKALSRAERERIAALLYDRADVGIGIVEVPELDRIGLTAANDLAMARAIENLSERPAHALVDGKRAPKAAKVERDQMMIRLAQKYPHYGWETNAGYGTAAHRTGLATHGVTPHHRRSFKPIAEILLKEQRVKS